MGHIEPYWKKRTHKTQSSSWWLFHHLTESTERKWYDPSYTSQTCPLVALSFNSQQYNTTEMRHKIRTYNQNHCSKSQRDQGIIDPSPGNQQLKLYIKVCRYRKNLITTIGLKENGNCDTHVSIYQRYRNTFKFGFRSFDQRIIGLKHSFSLEDKKN